MSKRNYLMDEGGIFMMKSLVQSRQEAESERETLQDALEEANQQNSELMLMLMDKLADTVQKLEEEKAETARLADELARVPTEQETAIAMEKENKTLKVELRVAKERHKKMWQMI